MPWYKDGQELELDDRLGMTGDDGLWRVALDAIDALDSDWGPHVMDSGRASWVRMDEELDGMTIWECDEIE
jgi:hypothetical protein